MTLALFVWFLGDASPSHAFPIPTIHFEKVSFPTIEIVTDTIPPATVEDSWLRDRGTQISAVRVEPFALPIAIAFVVSSDRIWLRSDLFDNDRRKLSGLALVEAMLRETAHDLGPAGSSLLIVAYDREAHVVLASTDSRQLPDHPFGSAENYQRDGRAIEHGVSLALEELSKVSKQRKLLVVIGDGQATDVSRTQPALYALARRARDEGVEVAAITYPLDYEGERRPRGNVMTGFLTTPTEAQTVADAATALRSILAETPDRYRIQFDARQLAWDGKIHSVEIGAGEVTFYGKYGVMLPGSDSPREISSWRWPVLVIVIAIGILGALILMVRRRGRVRGGSSVDL